MRFMGGTLHIGVDIPGDFFSFCDREVYFWSVLKDYKKWKIACNLNIFITSTEDFVFQPRWITSIDTYLSKFSIFRLLVEAGWGHCTPGTGLEELEYCWEKTLVDNCRHEQRGLINGYNSSSLQCCWMAVELLCQMETMVGLRDDKSSKSVSISYHTDRPNIRTLGPS